MKTVLALAAAVVFGVIVTLGGQFGINVHQKWGALKVAWENPKVVQSLQIAEPTFAIKK